MADLAKALGRSEEELTKVLVLHLQFLPVTGLIDDEIAVKVAKRFGLELSPLVADPEALQRALDARKVEGDRMIEWVKRIKRGEKPD